MVATIRRAAFCAGMLSVLACSPRLIPGTPFPDTKDTRAILEIVAKYKRAYEARDAQAVSDLSSVHYMDRRDLISHDTLVNDLHKTFDKVKDVHLDVKVNRVNIEGDKAQVDYFYSASFQIASNDPTAQWKTQSDDKRMILRREGEGWKVMSGF